MFIASLLLVGLVTIHGPILARATGEIYSLSSSPARTTEGSTDGVSLILSVSNAMSVPPTPYAFSFTVTDPSGASTSATKNVLSTVSSWTTTAIYPTDFSASLNLVGTYKVNVAETLPATNSSVGKSQFQVGLTDSLTYDRTAIMKVTGSGYTASDTVTIDIRQGTTHAPGFPTTTSATAGGLVSYSWQSSPASPLGIYNASLSGSLTPPKNIPDIQQFTLYPTNASVSQLWANTTSAIRTQILEIKFNSTYLDGSSAITGTAQLKLTPPGGTTTYTITASYDAAQHSFTAYYPTALSSATGTWTVSLPTDGFSDGDGNGGPSSPVTTTFSVQTANLTVNDGQYRSYSAGNVIPIIAKVLSPNGGNFTQGSVIAIVTSGGRTITGINLIYDPVFGRWAGSYQVNNNDPSGTWLVTIRAYDSYGNSGQTQSSFGVSTPGNQSPPPPAPTSFLTTWWWLIVILAIVGAGFGILISKRRGALHREVKLDLHAVHSKAEEVRKDDFLQSIQSQLKRRMDRMAKEKEQGEQEKKSD